MICPNCGKEMEESVAIFYTIAGWDMDYPDGEQYNYRCKECKIKKLGDEWKIPRKYERPTDKQINAILWINNILDLELEPLLKSQCYRDIKKYLPIA